MHIANKTNFVERRLYEPESDVMVTVRGRAGRGRGREHLARMEGTSGSGKSVEDRESPWQMD